MMATFIGENGTVQIEATADAIQQCLDAGYIIEWVPGVYEFTEAGQRDLTALLRAQGR